MRPTAGLRAAGGKLAVRTDDDACPGCGAVLPPHTGPTHAYLGTSPACWVRYERLERHAIEGPARGRVRRLAQSAYALQHPGRRQLRSVQSVALHLMDLCVLIERDGEFPRPVAVLGRQPARRVLDLHWLEPPDERGTITVVDALDGMGGEERAARIGDWADEVWSAWETHHVTVRRWLDRARANAADAAR